MTVNELVDKAYSYFNGKSVDMKAFMRFFNENQLNVQQELATKIFDYYNRKLIDDYKKRGAASFQEDYESYITKKKDMNSFVESIAKKLAMQEVILLRQKIDDLIDAAILWSLK